MFSFLKPAAAKPPLPKEQIDPTYRKLRMQVFLGTFIGYAGYYLVRKNFSFAAPILKREYGFDEFEIGIIASATALAYGISKFVMGNVSDRSNARNFLTLGLVLSSLVFIVFSFLPLSSPTMTTIVIMYAFIFLSGWCQGMGWAPCGRTMVHWFSASERGLRMSIWNLAHNVGGALLPPLAGLSLMLFGASNWQSVFFFPACVSLCIALLIYLLMRDTPQSCGLPPIEQYKNEYPQGYSEKHETEFSVTEIFFQYIIFNKFLWCIAFANAFIYLIRNGIIDWAPLYLENVKGYTGAQAKWACFAYEMAGIPGTLLCGIISDTVFKGRRAPSSIMFMVLIIIFILLYWWTPQGHFFLMLLAMSGLGFLIYGPVMMIGLHALELVPKKAAGTSAGLTGLFGYFFGTMLAGIVIGYIAKNYTWDRVFELFIASSVLAIVFIAFTWKTGEIKHHEDSEQSDDEFAKTHSENEPQLPPQSENPYEPPKS